MTQIIYWITSAGGIIFTFIKKIWPQLIAKFGWQAVALAIQKAFSVIIIAMVTSFWVGFVAFVTMTYVRVSDFMNMLNTLPSSGVGGGGSSEWLSCFASLLNASGINAGFTSALPLLSASLVFVLSTVLYTGTKELLVVIGNELSKHLNLLTR